MKRSVFWVANFGVYFVAKLMEYAFCGDCSYVTDAEAVGLILVYLFSVIALWNIYMQRAFDAGLKSQLHGAWCFVPLAILWFGFVPTGYHSRKEKDEMQEMYRDARG